MILMRTISDILLVPQNSMFSSKWKLNENHFRDFWSSKSTTISMLSYFYFSFLQKVIKCTFQRPQPLEHFPCHFTSPPVEHHTSPPVEHHTSPPVEHHTSPPAVLHVSYHFLFVLLDRCGQTWFARPLFTPVLIRVCLGQYTTTP